MRFCLFGCLLMFILVTWQAMFYFFPNWWDSYLTKSEVAQKFVFSLTFIFCSPICSNNCGVVFLRKYILVFVRPLKYENFHRECYPSWPRLTVPKNCKRVFHFFHRHVHVWLLNKNQIPFFILFSFFLFFWQILTNAKHTPTNVTSMLLVTTRTDHTFAHANLDILEMDTTVQVQSIISEAFIFVLTIIRNFCLFLLFLFVCLFVLF